MKYWIGLLLLVLTLSLTACNRDNTPDDNGDTEDNLSTQFFGDKTTEEWQAQYASLVQIDTDNNGVLDWQETPMEIVYASDFYDDADEYNTLFRNALKWAEQYPNITVVRDQRFKKAVTGNDDALAFDMLVASSQDGSMPDVFYAPLSAEVYDQDLTLDVTPYLRSDEEARFIRSNAFEFMTSFDGQEIWGVPYMSVSQFPAVNVGLLRQLDIAIPSYDWTYDDYEALRAEVATLTSSGSCLFPGIIDLSVHGAHYFDSVPNGWNGFNIETQRFDFSSAPQFGAWLTTIAEEGDQGLHFYDLSTEEQEALCGSYGWSWGDGFQVIDNMWMFSLSTDINTLITSRGLDIDIYPMPSAPEGGMTSLKGYYDAFGLSYELQDDPVRAEAVFDLVKWLTYGEDGTRSRWNLIEEDIATYGEDVNEWVDAGNDELDFPLVHPSTHLMDYIMGWPVTTNPNVIDYHPLVVGFDENSVYSVYNFDAFQNEAFQVQLSGPVAYPRQIPAAAMAVGEINIWIDIKERIRNEGYSYGALSQEVDSMMNDILDEYLIYYTK
jgi:multiple sugar transport system substrate-binding protein